MGPVANDPWVQETISGSRLEFFPQQGSRPGRIHLDAEKSQVLSQEVENLAAKEAIQSVADDREGYTGLIFLVPKSDGSWRPVDKLKITAGASLSSLFFSQAAACLTILPTPLHY